MMSRGGPGAMNSQPRSTSFSTSVPQIPNQRARRPSVSSRFSYAVSIAEQGEAQTAQGVAAQHQIEEEIAQIKRYEDFTTIDWVQDAAREQLRRKARRKRNAGLWDAGRFDWRHRIRESYDAAQGWIVVTIIGAAIGVNAAFLNIITEWLADIKLGHCKTAFYLNENFCCWGEDNGCDDWQKWTGFSPINYLIYILFAILFACTSATLVKSYAPYAAGSGISEIKCIIAGFVMKGFLGFWTLVIKSLALPLAIGSGLSVGKEGPSVHYAVCTGNVISRLFAKYRRNASKTREILSACAAAGVAVAFGSPIGGVLFSLEEMSSYFPLKTMWRSYFCALVATAVLSAMNPFRTGQLVMFQVHYDRSWHFFEILFFILLGIFGGLYGAFVMKWNLRVQAFRKKYLTNYAILEATLLAAATAIVCYPNSFLRIDMTESMEILFLECEGAEDYQGLCERDHRFRNVVSLLLATVIRIFFVIISYGCKVPAGIFVPSMAIGASFGRSVGIIVQALHEANPQSPFFAACLPDVPCITPGTYAFLGAAAALSGIMHITVSVVVIMFELTGALTYILPTMIVVGVTKAVSELFGKGGIADRMIWFSGFPFLDNKEDHNLGVPVSHAMIKDVTSIPTNGMTLQQIEGLLAEDNYQGFPIVEDEHSKILVGYIGRTELRYAVDRAKRERTLSPQAKCTFAPPPSADVTTPGTDIITPGLARMDSFNTIGFAEPSTTASASSSNFINFSRYVDTTPVSAHPRLPLETVMELFRKIGPRVILIEYHGKLMGLVTVKDCLKYQFKVEAMEEVANNGQHSGHGQGNGAEQQGDERLWELMQRVAGWVSDKVSIASGGRIRLRDSLDLPRETLAGGAGARVGSGTNRTVRSQGGARDDQILDGTEDEDEDGVELENRQTYPHGSTSR
ncbi:CLC voltage-gated chloride channel protein [Neurospora crassa OR74A]|uniref:Chloride channel protein n=2 Tax=Neurospora crassa (strain ATCC 24698 / 74-OR23-1A / CBS 708.71 / DSM 1257 / FGSC 987) TaxID=367110 RepID=V5IM01_NEUCR|nr:CLC voltage-gated chloride channel protein [Neurospora crassa OR74A]ESA42823.1 CLC voltage-gated chloride channel protein [Neurospora crassa OR74A]|eukprot:XP_011394201.1 CLC voltage-gated chloride channel protein [Neurospora crassa OR74A]